MPNRRRISRTLARLRRLRKSGACLFHQPSIFTLILSTSFLFFSASSLLAVIWTRAFATCAEATATSLSFTCNSCCSTPTYEGWKRHVDMTNWFTRRIGERMGVKVLPFDWLHQACGHQDPSLTCSAAMTRAWRRKCLDNPQGMTDTTWESHGSADGICQSTHPRPSELLDARTQCAQSDAAWSRLRSPG